MNVDYILKKEGKSFFCPNRKYRKEHNDDASELLNGVRLEHFTKNKQESVLCFVFFLNQRFKNRARSTVVRETPQNGDGLIQALNGCGAVLCERTAQAIGMKNRNLGKYAGIEPQRLK